MNTQYLGRVYAMQIKQWQSGVPVKVFTRSPKSDLHREFVISKLKIQPHQLERYWNRLIFTGTGRSPTVVDSEQEMIEMIINTPGAIGYISEKRLLGNLKVIQVVQ